MNGNIFYMDWEISLIEWLQKNLGDTGIAISKAISAIGGETIAMLVLLVVLFCYSKEAGKRVGLTLLAAWVGPALSAAVVNEMSAVGGTILIGLAITMLELGKERIKVSNMLPAIFLPIAYFPIAAWISGLLG